MARGRPRAATPRPRGLARRAPSISSASELWREGRLLAVYKDGRSRFPAYLDDHAFLLDGLIELLQTRWRSADLRFAIELAEALLDAFRRQRARRLLTSPPTITKR